MGIARQIEAHLLSIPKPSLGHSLLRCLEAPQVLRINRAIHKQPWRPDHAGELVAVGHQRVAVLRALAEPQQLVGIEPIADYQIIFQIEGKIRHCRCFPQQEVPGGCGKLHRILQFQPMHFDPAIEGREHVLAAGIAIDEHVAVDPYPGESPCRVGRGGRRFDPIISDGQDLLALTTG